jgi:hypothetical protein
MTRAQRAWCVCLTACAVVWAIEVSAQTPTPTPSPSPARGAQAQEPPRGRPGGRAGLPPLAANMSQQQLQAYMDTYAVIQAERELRLTAEQYPNFVAKLRRLQDTRRRQMGERRRILGELNGLLQGGESAGPAGRDEAITARLGALEEIMQQSAADLRKAYQDLDAGLTPWQRGRFRTFEEQLERQKIELLAKIRSS